MTATCEDEVVRRGKGADNLWRRLAWIWSDVVPPGHCGLYHDLGRDLIVYHAYDTDHDSVPTLRIAELKWDAAGWPSALT